MIKFFCISYAITQLFIPVWANKAKNCIYLPSSAITKGVNPHLKTCKFYPKKKFLGHEKNHYNTASAPNSLLGLFQWYHQYISSQDGAVCNFKPTCSKYMKNSLQKKGIMKGIILGFERLLRDHPFIRWNDNPYNKAKD